MSIDYAFDERPAIGSAVAVADDLLWLRMPLPFELQHINLWLLRDGDGWTIVDTGLGDDATRSAWELVFSGPMQAAAATAIVVTHMHPDHVGCAGHLARHFEVDLYMSRADYLQCRILVADTGRQAPPEALRFYRAAGYSDEDIAAYEAAFGMFGRVVTPLPEAFRRLRDGDELTIGEHRWRVITGGGHAPEHACLYDAERHLLLSGDQLLPTISSNISVWPTEPDADPLTEWFTSLDTLHAALPEDVLVLPAHGKPFRGAHARLDEIRRGHEQRLERLLDCCREPRRAVDTFDHLFRARITRSNRIMATGEALAHLHYLEARGELERESRAAVDWYRTTAR